MKILTNKQVEKILNLRKEGKSLTEIYKILELKKTTVYYHLRKNFGRSYKLVKIRKDNLELIGEIIGIFAADGGAVPQSDYQIIFYIGMSEEKYIKKLTVLLHRLFSKKPKVYKYKKINKCLIKYKSKDIYRFIRKYLLWEGKKTYSVRLKKINQRKEFLVGFLRGYFDGDGYSVKKYKKISIGTSSIKMSRQLFKIMKKLSFDPTHKRHSDKRSNRKPHYIVSLKGQEAKDFIKKIQPNNPNRIRKWAMG